MSEICFQGCWRVHAVNSEGLVVVVPMLLFWCWCWCLVVVLVVVVPCCCSGGGGALLLFRCWCIVVVLVVVPCCCGKQLNFGCVVAVLVTMLFTSLRILNLNLNYLRQELPLSLPLTVVISNVLESKFNNRRIILLHFTSRTLTVGEGSLYSWSPV